MAYLDISHPDVPRPSGVVVPMLTALGHPYPESLRVQQVGLSVVKAVSERIDKALAGGAIKLSTVHLGAAGKAMLKAHLLGKLFPELYADPIPERVRAAKKVVSPKALTLINDRLEAAFSPPVLDLPGVRLTRADLYDLLTLLAAELLDDEEFDPAERLAARQERELADRKAALAAAFPQPAGPVVDLTAAGEGADWDALFGPAR
jgi:hypothetical protein